MIHALKRLPPGLSGLTVLLFLLIADAPYLLVQASFVMGDLFGARRFAAVDAPTPSEEELFARVRAIREFGIGELDLAETRAFTRYKRIDRDALVWVVSGVRELSWKRHVWHYPLVGALPYRGYYREADASREASRLRSSGYDVVYRRVTAFSFLGFLPDPLYSFALERTYASLAELILHEMTHAALFVPGQGGFNENLASFVGAEGARQYIQATYGVDSQEYRQMIARREDNASARRLIIGLHEELAAFYESTSEDVPATEARVRKEAIFTRFQDTLAEIYDSRFQTDAYRWLLTAELNNAIVDLYLTYSSEQETFATLLEQRDGSVGMLMRDLRAIRSQIAARGMEALDTLVHQARPENPEQTEPPGPLAAGPWTTGMR